MEDVVVDGEDGEAGEDGLELDTGDCDEMDGVEEMEDAPLDLDLEEIKENVEPSKTPNAVKTNKTKAETPVKKSKLKSKSSPRPPSPSPLRTRKLNDPEPLSLRPAKKQPHSAQLKPLVCPGKKCNDILPEVIPPALTALLAQKKHLDAKDTSLDAKICEVLKKHNALLAEATHYGWPQPVNFDKLSSRVESILPDLNPLRSDIPTLQTSPVWLKFLQKINYSVYDFSRNPSAYYPDADLGAGYYGPKGLYIMKKLMSEYFKEESENDDDEPHNSLYHTLSELTDLPQPWDQYDETSNLIPLSRFHDVVLVPHIVASLISEDLHQEKHPKLEQKVQASRELFLQPPVYSCGLVN
ncbi:hypothetical protein FB45DRAFT_882190 [Roridomyces roridus]|uniref:Restriction of telomere capping protein 4 C-terminal domain-containing protein n=1 Tax=Roridomyces roridus TaxID=1738132 RepID=A0AAD7AXJ6_9AGAR|nr:hypothetical protein FB45DRAFT_882190 [Roridomyces roridus]